MPTTTETLARAKARHRTGQLQAAEQDYRQILEADTANPEVFYLLGALCHTLGKPNEAVKNLQQALRLNPNYAEAYNHLGVVLAKEKYLPEAVTSFQQALRLKPDLADAQNNLGKVAADLRNHQGAKKVLNVGGNNKNIPIPSLYQGWMHILLDIDPKGHPDVVCDAREMTKLPPSEYDAIYCSHNLEHYYRHDVPKVLSGFRHVLKEDGFAHIRVPDLGEVMTTVVQRGLDIDDVLYECGAGPITVRDVVFGWGLEIERSGCDFFAHKTGFTLKSLTAMLQRCGFPFVFTSCGNLEIEAFAFKSQPTELALSLLNLPPAK